MKVNRGHSCNLFPGQTPLGPSLAGNCGVVGKGSKALISGVAPKTKSLDDFSANVTRNLPLWFAIFLFCSISLVLSNCCLWIADLHWLGCLRGCCQDVDLAHLTYPGYSNRASTNWLSCEVVAIPRGYVHSGTMLNPGLIWDFLKRIMALDTFPNSLGYRSKGLRSCYLMSFFTWNWSVVYHDQWQGAVIY